MLDPTLGEATTIAAGAVIVLIVLAVLAARVLKQVTQQIAAIAILGVLALVVWSQRVDLRACADEVTAGRTSESTCAFFGREIRITPSRTP